MINLSLNDDIQIELAKHLSETESLLAKVATKLSRRRRDAEIVLLPDLGVSSNLTRMNGGFFTGVFAHWESDVPFIPIDSTINSCGVSIFTLNEEFTVDMFTQTISDYQSKIAATPYLWNFDTGNHFIIFGCLQDGSLCIVSHSSAKEYKLGNLDSGLYPEDNNWYAKDICTEYDDSGKRFLRYIHGDSAERFIEIAQSLREYNANRHRVILGTLFRDMIKEEVLNTQHYGMPSRSSISIGCVWTLETYPLLTALNKEIYIVRPTLDAQNTINTNEGTFTLSPHGFGSKSAQKPTIEYENNKIRINGELEDNFYYDKERFCIRGSECANQEIETLVGQILARCPGEVLSTITPLCTYSKQGITMAPNRRME